MLLRAVVAVALLGIATPALAEPENINWPNYQEGDFIITNYKFASGETLSTETALPHPWLCAAQCRR